MKKQFSHRTLALFTAACLAAIAATRASAALSVSIPTVTVGNPGNAADYTGYGAVNYTYNIGEYDVTSAQYCTFLNAVAASDPFGIYHPNMANTNNGDPGIVQSGTAGNYTYNVIDGRGNLPVTEVSFWNATRFANWLNNGQPNAPEGSGTTETGAYDLIDSQMDTDLLNTPTNKNLLTTNSAENNAIVRSSAATWAIASVNEWYKAAYYDPQLNGSTGAYYKYATQSNTITTADANYDTSDTTPYGSYPASSYFGTFDQAGNVYEWNENIDYGYNVRDIRGGAFNSANTLGPESDNSNYEQPYVAYNSIGFRVTELTVVPEPTSLALLSAGATGLLLRRRSQRK